MIIWPQSRQHLDNRIGSGKPVCIRHRMAGRHYLHRCVSVRPAIIRHIFRICDDKTARGRLPHGQKRRICHRPRRLAKSQNILVATGRSCGQRMCLQSAAHASPRIRRRNANLRKLRDLVFQCLSSPELVICGHHHPLLPAPVICVSGARHKSASTMANGGRF